METQDTMTVQQEAQELIEKFNLPKVKGDLSITGAKRLTRSLNRAKRDKKINKRTVGGVD